MKDIRFYLNVFLKKEINKNFLKKLIKKSILTTAGIDIKEDNIFFKGNVILLKIKPILKQQVLLKKNIILELLKRENFFFKNIT